MPTTSSPPIVPPTAPPITPALGLSSAVPVGSGEAVVGSEIVVVELSKVVLLVDDDDNLVDAGVVMLTECDVVKVVVPVSWVVNSLKYNTTCPILSSSSSMNGSKCLVSFHS